MHYPFLCATDVFSQKKFSKDFIKFVSDTCLMNYRIGSCLACVYQVMNACGKFGEHERSVRVARGDS